MTAHWYISVYDRKTERLLFDGLLRNATDEGVREIFAATPDAIGGFEVLAHHVPSLEVSSGADLDLSGLDLAAQVAFVELLEDEDET